VTRARPSLFTRLWSRYGLKAVRYVGVSAVNVTVGQTLLVLFHGVLGWPGVAANVSAVVLSTVPAYLMMRHWVWGQKGSHRVAGEIVPFWTMAAIGLVLSTLAVAWADRRWDSTIAIQLANISAFGLVWVSRFFILDHLMWSDEKVADRALVEEAFETP
jgi:putative flippase GtrA